MATAADTDTSLSREDTEYEIRDSSESVTNSTNNNEPTSTNVASPGEVAISSGDPQRTEDAELSNVDGEVLSRGDPIESPVSSAVDDDSTSDELVLPSSSTVQATVSVSSHITQETTNFLRLSLLVLKVTPTAVRQMFDTYFPRYNLYSILTSKEPKLREYYEQRKLTNQQWSILYPGKRPATSSTSFDMTLMIFLLIDEIKGWDCSSPGAYNTLISQLTKIRNARNLVAHNTTGTLTNYEFSNQWRDMKNAIVEVGGSSYKDEIEALQVASIDTRDHEILMEIKTLRHELDELRENRMPENIQDLNAIKIKRWEEENETFVHTHSAKETFSKVKQFPCVVIRGHSGSGKSTIAHNAALKLQNNGFKVISVSYIDDVVACSNSNEKQVFVMDDPLGTNSFDESELLKWYKQEENVKILCSKYGMKLIITSRMEALDDDRLLDLPTFFKETVINLHDIELTSDERKDIILAHLNSTQKELTEEELEAAVTIKMFCFPLICRLFASEQDKNITLKNFLKKPVDQLKKSVLMIQKNNILRYFILLLCLVFENQLSDKLFWDHGLDQESKSKMQLVSHLLGIQENFPKVSLTRALDSLEHTFLQKDGEVYHFIHDMIYDAVVTTLPDTLYEYVLKHNSLKFIKERVVFSDKDTASDNFIIVGKALGGTFCERFITEIKDKKYEDVFLHCSLQNAELQKIMVEVLKTKWSQDIVNIFCSSQSTKKDPKEINELKTFDDMILRNDSSLCSPNAKEIWRSFRLFSYLNKEECTAFHWVLARGIRVVFEFLWSCFDDKVKESLNAKIPLLPLASISGNLDILKILSQTGSSLDSPNTEDLQPPALYLASSFGDLEIVKALIEDFSVDINKCRHGSGGITSMHIAAQNGHVDVLNYLLDKNAELNKQTDKGYTPLHYAAINQHLKCIKALVKHDADIRIVNGVGKTPFNTACSNGNTQHALKLLYNDNELVNKPEYDGRSPLWNAAFNGHIETISYLLECGADINMVEKRKTTPLWIAAQNGHAECVELFLSKGAEINVVSDDGASPLFIAGQYGHYQCVKILLKARADMNLKIKNGKSTLIIVSEKGHTDIAKLYLSNGAEVNYCAKGTCGTALMYASASGNLDIAKLLLEYGADINQQRDDGSFALHCVSDKNNVELLDFLLTKGANVNLQLKSGSTSLLCASFYGLTENVLKLIQYGADVNCDSYGSTPIWNAAKNGHTETVKVLIENGADVNCNYKGSTPICEAAGNAHTETVKVLIENGVDVNRGSFGSTPIWNAAKNGHLETVKLLIENGADVNCDSSGSTPIWNAAKYGHTETVKVLIENGAGILLRSKTGISTIDIACRNKHYDISDLLRLHLNAAGQLNKPI